MPALGPYSQATRLARVDGRSREGRLLRSVRDELTTQIGNPSPAQKALIDRAAWLVCGRRAGKSFVLALIAVYLAVFKDWRACLSPGERGHVMILATNRRQARVIFHYIRALITEVPALKALLEKELVESLELANGITIEVQTA